MSKISEFAKLNDLVLERGYEHSELLKEINETILDEYKSLYRDKAKTAEVLLNEETGEVKLFSDGKDITPSEFRSHAESMARSILIEKLSSQPDKKSEKSAESSGNLGRFLMAVVFWGYNLIYIIGAFSFLANLLTDHDYLSNLFNDFRIKGLFGISFYLTAALTPLISIIIAIKYYLNKKYDKPGLIFFLFELPIVIVSLFFANSFTDPTPFMWFTFLMILFALPALLFHLLESEPRSQFISKILLFINESIFLFSCYFSLIFSFFSPLIIGYLGRTIFEFISDAFFSPHTGYRGYSYYSAGEIFFVIIFGSLYILIILGLTFLPYLITYFFGKVFIKSRKNLLTALTPDYLNRLTAIFAVVWTLVFAASGVQPNPEKYIKKLETLTETKSFEEREAIASEMIPQETKIRRIFEDLKEVNSRYIFRKDDDTLKEAYTQIYSLPEKSAQKLQDIFSIVAYPIVYQGDLKNQSKAIANFEYLFGTAEQDKYVAADSKNVEVLSRKISAATYYDDLTASVSVEEEYRTSATRDQEVVYEFYLPEGSVVTELKLGPNLEFNGTIAPKGAAATVYQREVNKARDPALLEQTGPDQYRLRIFPVPSKNSNLLMGRNQKVMFRYVTLLTPDGFPLPVYSKRQNIKGLPDPVVTVNNQKGEITKDFITSESINKKLRNFCSLTSDVTAKSKISQSSIVLIPNLKAELSSGRLDCRDGRINAMNLGSGLNIAVLIDVSYMNKNNPLTPELEKLLSDNKKFISKNNVDLYKFNDKLSGAIRLKEDGLESLKKLTFFGTSNWIEAENRLSGNYDFVVILTGSGDNQIVQGQRLSKKYPVFVVHPDYVPPYTGPITKDMLQTGGGSFKTLADAFNKGVISRQGIPVPDGYSLFSTESLYSFATTQKKNELLDRPEWNSTEIDKTDPISLIFAGEFIKEKFAVTAGDLENQIYFLDSINNFSKINSLVSPSSSLIALVNEVQAGNLVSQSQNYDRYKDTTTSQSSFRISNPSFGGGGGFGMFGGIDTLSLDVPSSNSVSGVTGGGGGGINIAPGGQFSELGSTGYSSGIVEFIIINIALIGIGVIFYAFVRISKRRKKSSSTIE